MGKRELVVFDQFGAGDYGAQGDWLAPKGSLSLSNTLPYIDGSIGPRAGIKALGVTGLPVGQIDGFGWNPASGKVWFVYGNTVRNFIATSGLTPPQVTMTGTLAGTPTRRVHSDDTSASSSSGVTYMTSRGDGVYAIDFSANAIAKLTGSTGGNVVALYGDRLVVGGFSGNGNRLLYSAAGNFNSWPAANFIDVGDASEIVVLVAQRGNLLIGKSDGTWWLLTGVPGVNDTLRKVTRSYVTASARLVSAITRWAKLADESIIFAPDQVSHPVLFNGSSFYPLQDRPLLVTENDAIDDTGARPSLGFTPLFHPGDWFSVASPASDGVTGYVGTLYTRGKFSKHYFSGGAAGLKGYAGGAFSPYIWLVSTASGSPAFYSFAYMLDRPPFHTGVGGSVFESLGDPTAPNTPVSAGFTTPEWWAKNEEEVAVRSVTVDFKKWQHGYTTQDNGFTVRPQGVNKYNGVGSFGSDGLTGTAKSWSENQNLSSTSGTNGRMKFNFSGEAQWGNGFRIGIESMVGVAIKKIHVVVDVRPQQGV